MSQYNDQHQSTSQTIIYLRADESCLFVFLESPESNTLNTPINVNGDDALKIKLPDIADVYAVKVTLAVSESVKTTVTLLDDDGNVVGVEVTVCFITPSQLGVFYFFTISILLYRDALIW